MKHGDDRPVVCGITPDGVHVYVRYGRPDYVRPADGGLGVDNLRAILTFDRTHWVTLRFNDPSFALGVVREKYRTREQAVARAEALIAMAEAGDLPTTGYPWLVWRRWGPDDPHEPPFRQSRQQG